MKNRPLPSELPIVGVVVTIWVLCVLTVHGYGTDQTLSNIIVSAVPDGLLAAGLTVCLLAGQIDLSIGSNLAFTGVVFATLEPHVGVVMAAAAGVLSGTGVGMVNAFLVTVVGVQSFVATLGTLLAVQGAAFVVSNGNPVEGTDLPLALRLSKPLFGPVTPSILLLVLVVGAAHLFVTRMRWGREIVAVGGNRAAAAAAGIPANWRVVLSFIISGTLAGIAGVELSAALESGSPLIGSTDLLTAAAGCFLGGVALTGGRGSVVSSVLAVIALSALATGLELSFINAAYQQVITGVVLMAVAAQGLATVVVRRRRSRAPAH